MPARVVRLGSRPLNRGSLGGPMVNARARDDVIGGARSGCSR